MNKLKDEVIFLGILFLLFMVIFKILFYKESILIILRLIASFFWMLILPGFILMFNWREKISFTSRLIISIALSAAIIGISSYYLGMVGIHIKFHGILLPAVFIILGFLIFLKKKSYSNKQKEGN